jgi:ribosome-associated protein
MSERLVVTPECSIDLDEVEVRFSPSGGPGGQHANRSNTRVELRFDVAGSPSLDEGQRRRIRSRLGDEVRVVADDERSQLRNRAIAVDRLRIRLADALKVQRRRRPTRPSAAAKTRRLDAKRRRGEDVDVLGVDFLGCRHGRAVVGADGEKAASDLCAHPHSSHLGGAIRNGGELRRVRRVNDALLRRVEV